VDLPLSDKVIDSPHHLFHRSLRVKPMKLKQINRINL